MARPEHGLPKGFQLRAVLANEALWDIADEFPQHDPRMGGRPRDHPTWVMAVFLCMVTIHTSARKAATEMADDWETIQQAGRDRYPDDPSRWASDGPVRRHHWQYFKTLVAEEQVRIILDAFEDTACDMSREAGVCDPDGGGSIGHPGCGRVNVGDGKVITPLYKAKKGTRLVDKETGEILGNKKYDPDAKMHTTGGGHPAYGNKFVLFASRTEYWHSRWITSLDYVPDTGGEARVAMDCLERTLPKLPGVQAVLYDGAMRGKHHRQALRDLGVQMISPPAAARAESDEGPREEKTTFIESIPHPTDEGRELSLYGQGGALGVLDYDADGEPHFTPLRRLRTRRGRNKDGTYRWYCDFALPPSLGGGELAVRMDTTDDDVKRGVNRSENLRIMSPLDPDYERIYPLRSDIEACNRQLDDTLWLRRAHSVGATHQLLDLIGYALVYNSVALALARERAHSPPGGALAA